MKRRVCAWLALLVLFGWKSDAVAVVYTYTNMADSATPSPVSGSLTGFEEPSISGNTVAFKAHYDGGHGIFTGSGGSLTTIVKEGDLGPAGPFWSFSGPAISGSSVAFQGRMIRSDEPSGVFVGNGGLLTTIAPKGDSASFGDFSFNDAVISDDVVAFRASYAGGVGIFTGSGGPLTTIAKVGDPAPSGTFNNVLEPSISGTTVAFLGTYGELSLFTGSGGPLTTVVTSGDPSPVGMFASVGSPSINGDQVAFIGSDEAGAGIFKMTIGGPATTIVRVGDSAPSGEFHFVDHPAIRDNTVAFFGSFSGPDESGNSTVGGNGIFTGSGGPLSTVIKTGDSLFGSVVIGLSATQFGGSTKFGFDAGDGGNVAFAYTLADGRRGVAMASIVPEPSSLLLCCVSITTIASMIRFRRRTPLAVASSPMARR